MYGIGRGCARHHKLVLLVWLLGVVGIWATGISLGGHTNNTFEVPGVQSQEALDQLAVGFPQAAGASATIVYHTTAAGTKVTSSQIESQINASIKDLQGQPDVLFVSDPLNPATPKVSTDGSTALANVQYTKATQDLPGTGQDSFDALEAMQQKYSTPQLQIELGGQLPGAQPIDIKDSVVIFGLIAALIVLLIALGTWWSFAWPVVGALVGTALGMGIVQILERFVAIPTLAETAGVMIGLGVGIDYGLFRHRPLQGGHSGWRRAAAGGWKSGQHRRACFLDRWIHGRCGAHRLVDIRRASSQLDRACGRCRRCQRRAGSSDAPAGHPRLGRQAGRSREGAVGTQGSS